MNQFIIGEIMFYIFILMVILAIVGGLYSAIMFFKDRNNNK